MNRTGAKVSIPHALHNRSCDREIPHSSRQRGCRRRWRKKVTKMRHPDQPGGWEFSSTEGEEGRWPAWPDFEVRTFNAPDETRRPEKTQVDVVKMGGNTAARLTLEPGWKWSECIKPLVGTESCQVRHVGVVQSGRMHVVHDDGTESEIGPGEAYVIEPGHDAWVVGGGRGRLRVRVADCRSVRKGLGVPSGHTKGAPRGAPFRGLVTRAPH